MPTSTLGDNAYITNGIKLCKTSLNVDSVNRFGGRQDNLIDWLRLGSRPHGPDAPRPHINLWELSYFAKVPGGPQTYTLDVLWLQGGAQTCKSEWSQSFMLTKNVCRGFFLLTKPPTQWTVWQPFLVKMSPQGTISCEKASNSPGLCPVNGQKPNLGIQTGSQINSQACLCVLPRPRHHTQCWLTN
jgi:hypothetical protein